MTDQPDTERNNRRATVAFVLGRLDQSAATTTELRTLRSCIAEEQADADQARAKVAKARQQRDYHRGIAEAARRRLVFIAEAPLDVDVWARLGMALGWTPERAGTEARKQRLPGERQLAATADTLRRQLTAAKAESDGLAETMRNTDRVTEQQLAGAHAEAVSLRQRLADAHDRHNRRRITLSDALGIGASASWDAITDRARESTGAPLVAGQRLTSAAYAHANAAGMVREANKRAEAAEERARKAEHRLAETEAERLRMSRLLRETENQLGEVRRRAETWRVDAATQGEIVKQRSEERDRHAATIERMKRTNRMVNGGARAERERAEQAEAALARVRKATDALTPLAARHIEEAIGEPADDLAAYTAPVSPRELGVAEGGHPIHALRAALEGPPVQHYEATALIQAYYRAVTSAPPADPAERPLAITVAVDLTDEQVRAVVKRAARLAVLGRSVGDR